MGRHDREGLMLRNVRAHFGRQKQEMLCRIKDNGRKGFRTRRIWGICAQIFEGSREVIKVA